jgi:RNA polymerase sigma-70 factor (ECF subfamily)
MSKIHALRLKTECPDPELAEARVAAWLDAGDLAGAATEALRAYGTAVRHYLRSLDQDDVAHELFAEFSERLWTALPRFRREASMRTWVFKLAWTTAQDWKRRAARNRVRRLDTSEADKLVAEIRSTTPAYQRGDAADRWRALQASLSAEDRSLLLLRLDQRLPWRDVAQVMARGASSLDVATLRKRFERLKARLRELAEQHGVRSRP